MSEKELPPYEGNEELYDLAATLVKELGDEADGIAVSESLQDSDLVDDGSSDEEFDRLVKDLRALTLAADVHVTFPGVDNEW